MARPDDDASGADHRPSGAACASGAHTQTLPDMRHANHHTRPARLLSALPGDLGRMERTEIMTDLLMSMHPWAVFTLGVMSATVIWMGLCWTLLDQRDRARWEASQLRVCRCQLRSHHDDPARRIASASYRRPMGQAHASRTSRTSRTGGEAA
jgi:hypothetical protein